MISITRYVNITSGVGGGAAVRARDFILRLFTTNDRVPYGAVVEMTTLADVLAYFGAASAEYARAAFYFGFVNKMIAAPQKIAFARWANAITAAKVYGAPSAAPLASFNAVASGSFKLTMAGFTFDMLAINLSASANLAAVATAIQTAVRAQTGGGTPWTGATVLYDAPTNSFNLVAGTGGTAGPISVAAAATGTPIAALLGWASALTVFSPGIVAAEEPVASWTNSVGVSDNFGTFNFISVLSQAQYLALATANSALNVKFFMTIGFATFTDGAVFYAALANLSGVAWTYSPLATEFPELLPAAILASTDYNKRNTTQNYMFQKGVLTPSVTDNTSADTMDNSRSNYYGRTMSAGQNIDFYQRGVMGGLPTNPVDMNVYTNEMWLKDAALAAIMSLLLSLPKVSANAQGKAQLKAVLQSVIDRALVNGTISLGKLLNVTQQLYIANLTNDALAYLQVQNIGYWLDIQFSSYVTVDSRTEFQANYTLIYSKDDTIRKVVGQHVLI